VSSNSSPIAPQSATPATPRAPYVAPTLEPLGSWSALTMVGSGGVGGFVQNPIVTKIVRGGR